LLLLSHDLKYFGEELYGELSNNLVEIRKMPNALLQRPKADRYLHTAKRR
jgi:hypothetical protein